MPITTKEAAKRLGTTPDMITLGIRAGKYTAKKVAPEGSNRPVWMVDEASLGTRNRTRKASKAQTRKPRTTQTKANKESVVIEWFLRHSEKFPSVTLQEIRELVNDLG